MKQRNGGIYKIIRIESVDHVAELDPLDVAARIDELKLLTDGWLDGAGKALDSAALDWVQELFGTHFPNHLQLPFLYPTPDGGIQAEWSIGTTEITLEIDLKEQTGDWHQYDSESEDEIVESLHFKESDAIAWVVHRIEESQRDTIRIVNCRKMTRR